MNDSNETLAERAARGDREALSQLLTEHLPTLRAFVRLRTGPLVRAREAESDIVQSVCREVLERAGDFRHAGDSGFRRWLYTTTLRKVLTKDEHHRAAKRDPDREIDCPDHDAELRSVYQRFATPSEDAIALEESARVEQALTELTPEDREVVLLSRIAGLSRADVAAEMGRTEDSVKGLLHRALAKLARQLERQ